MRFKILIVIAVAVVMLPWVITGCDRQQLAPPGSAVIARVRGYAITAGEFEEAFTLSAFAARADKLQARRECLDWLINQKLILLDAQRHDLDKSPDFMKSIEKFWAQSLLSVAMEERSLELRKEVRVREVDVRRIYDNMVKDGVTTKSFEDVYPQIKWQAEKQAEAQLLNSWINGLRKGADVSINDVMLMSMK
ncbi:MAG: hypothetical protein HQL17_05585 [Candidatus Omnitrophica bacterium]|nr:hypothetical protein [Candidatus Omnitrophota bacterium]